MGRYERGGNLGVSGIPEQINRTLRKNEIYCEEKTTLEPDSDRVCSSIRLSFSWKSVILIPNYNIWARFLSTRKSSASFSWITEFFMNHRVLHESSSFRKNNNHSHVKSLSFSWITEFFYELPSFSWILKLRDSNKDSYEGVNKIVISCSIKESFKVS